jgi:hypothetical protein
VLDALALKMLLQLAMQDIGQLTDIEPRPSHLPFPSPEDSIPADGDSAPAGWSV